MRCLFVSDLHGRVDRYEKLFEQVARVAPQVVLLGGDLLPPFSMGSESWDEGFVAGFLAPRFRQVLSADPRHRARILLILGNDDPRSEEESFLAFQREGLWEYLHGRSVRIESVTFYGYSYVPPTPFLLKDWERYDVSRYTPPGSVSPEGGFRSVDVEPRRITYATIAEDLQRLVGDADLTEAVMLIHGPPYETCLDRAALDGQMIDYVPLDVHVGSIAVRRFIETRQPKVSLHGHVHESARITGAWRDLIGRTHLFSAAHDGSELSLVEFDTERPEAAVRRLL
jgi:Icc-related predicted phosphoesterase